MTTIKTDANVVVVGGHSPSAEKHIGESGVVISKPKLSYIGLDTERTLGCAVQLEGQVGYTFYKVSDLKLT